MTTYYGVWSGKDWYYVGQEIFHTLSLGLARAQAMSVSGWFPQTAWEARVIGEDGLPEEKGIGVTVDLWVDAERRLRKLPSVEAAHVMVEFILHRTACLLSPPQFAEYVQGVKAIAKTIIEALGTDRGVSLIGTIGGVHEVDIMRER